MSDLEQELKQLIIKTLNLEDITPDQIDDNEPLFGEGIGLDSIDALELGVALRKKYNIRIATVTEDVRAHFANIHNLATYIKAEQGQVS